MPNCTLRIILSLVMHFGQTKTKKAVINGREINPKTDVENLQIFRQWTVIFYFLLFCTDKNSLPQTKTER